MINREAQEEMYNKSYEECFKKIDNHNFHASDYFERKPTSVDRQNYLKAVEARTKREGDNGIIILEQYREK